MTTQVDRGTHVLGPLWIGDGINRTDGTRYGNPVLAIDVKAYGAVGDGVTDDTAAIHAAVDALPSSGGVVYLPAGTYRVSATIDLTGKTNVCFCGAGLQNTIIVTSVTTTPGIIATSPAAGSRLVDFSIYQSALAIPVATRAGNYGIRTSVTNPGVGTGFGIERVGVRYFANDAIYLAGASAPFEIASPAITFCYGYGITLDIAAGAQTQDCSIGAGWIQSCRGGLKVMQAASLSVRDTDIELADVGAFPCVQIDSGAQSADVTLIDLSLSVGVGATSVAVVNAENVLGLVISGGLNFANNGGHNIYLNGAVDGVVVTGGYYTGKAAGAGYFMKVVSAGHITVIQPFISTSTYAANHDAVSDLTSNNVTVIGAKSVRNTDTTGIASNYGTFTNLALSTGAITHGTYTPTLTNAVNVAASTAYVAQWLRVGTMVKVSGLVDIDATATGDTQLGISLPVVSNLTNFAQLSGIGAASTAVETGGISGDDTNDRALFRYVCVNVANHSFAYDFMYQVLP